MTYHVQFLLLVLAGWVNRQQQDVIDYLREENRVLRGGLRGKRLRLSDDDRRRLAVKALPWCITLDNSKGISRLRFGAKNSRVNGINDLPVFMHQGINEASLYAEPPAR